LSNNSREPGKRANFAGARQAFLAALLDEAATPPNPAGAARGTVSESGESESMSGSPRAKNRSNSAADFSAFCALSQLEAEFRQNVWQFGAQYRVPKYG